FLDMAKTQRIGCVPAHAGQHHFERIMHSLDY
ncbi:hypothetical protein AAKU67_004449, partial [Oxalobacteraceae bacterium GrIS 2.11]